MLAWNPRGHEDKETDMSERLRLDIDSESYRRLLEIATFHRL